MTKQNDCLPIYAREPNDLALIAAWKKSHYPNQTEHLPEAVSDHLNVDWLRVAYLNGMFPWYSVGEPVYWWSPNPRMVLLPNEFKLHDSLKKIIKKRLNDPINDSWQIRMNHDFESTIRACSQQTRAGQAGTWITDDVIRSYCDLHHLGHAHSIETWYQNELVGGLYFVHFGQIVFGESMFAKVTDASKMAFYHLIQWCLAHNILLIDCQQKTQHLSSLGAKTIEKSAFLSFLERATVLIK